MAVTIGVSEFKNSHRSNLKFIKQFLIKVGRLKEHGRLLEKIQYVFIYISKSSPPRCKVMIKYGKLFIWTSFLDLPLNLSKFGNV